MKWNFRDILLAIAMLTVCTSSFSQSEHTISGLEAAKHYHGKSTGKLYIRTGSFANQGNAIRYEAYVAAHTRYPVKLTHRNRFYIVTIGPIGSAAEARRVGGSINSNVKHARIKAAIRKREFVHLADNEAVMGNTSQSVKAAKAINSVKTKQTVTPAAVKKVKNAQVTHPKAIQPGLPEAVTTINHKPTLNSNPVVKPVTDSIKSPAVAPETGISAGKLKPDVTSSAPSEMLPFETDNHVATPAKKVSTKSVSTKHSEAKHRIATTTASEMNQVTLRSLVEQNSVKPADVSGFSDANWLIAITGGAQFPFYNNSATVNNGSGAAAPFNRDIYTTKKDNEPILGLSAGRRWMFNEGWFPSVTGMLSYQHLFAINPGGKIIQYSDPEFTNYTYNWKMTSDVVLAVIKLNIIQYGQLSPYITGGVGSAFNRSNDYTEYPLAGVTPRVTPGYATNSSIQLAYGLGAGLDYQLNRQVLFSLEYRYLSLGTLNSGTGSGSWSSERLDLGSYRSNTVQLSVGYLFGD